MRSGLPFQSARRRSVLSRAVWRVRAGNYSDSLHALVDESGNGLHALLGGSATPTSNDPLRLQYFGRKDVRFPASSGNYISTPDSANIPRGDITVEVEANADDWSPASTVGLVAHDGAAGNRSMVCGLSSNAGVPCLRVLVSVDGTVIPGYNSSDIPALLDGQWFLVRYVRTKATGAWSFFYSTDGGQSWTSAGTAAAIGAGSDLFDSTSILEIGSATGGTTVLFPGRVRRMRMWSDTTQTNLVYDFNAANLVEPYATVADGVSGTWTLNRSSSGRKLAVVDRDMFLFGTDDFMEVANSPLLNFAANEDMTAVVAYRHYSAQTGVAILAKRSTTTYGATAAVGWAFRRDTTTSVFIVDGAEAGIVGAGVLDSGTVFGVATLLFGVRQGLNRRVGIQKAGGVFTGDLASATAGSLVNTDNMRIGRFTAGGSGYGDMELLGAAVFREALSSADCRRLACEMEVPV